MLSRITFRELELDEDEAKRLGEAVAAVNDLYDWRISDQATAWTNLAMVAAEVYGSRAVAIMNNRKRARPIAVIPGQRVVPQSTQVENPIN
jgi:hypothetical protein